MKATRLQIKNIGMIEDIDIPIDRPMIVFYGDICQGKTTILNAVRWLFGGAYPDDIIRHGEKKAGIQLATDSGSIRREWYVAKSGKAEAKPITFIRNGVSVKNPVLEIRKLLNPFLLNQNHLVDMNEIDRARFLVDVLGVDVTAIDSAIAAKEAEARDLRSELKAYGEIDLTPCELIDEEPLLTERGVLLAEYDREVLAYNAARDAAIKRESDIQRVQSGMKQATDEIAALEARIAELRARIEKGSAWLQTLPELQQLPVPVAPDVSAIDAKLSDAKAAVVRVEQYQRNMARAKERDAKQAALDSHTDQLRDLRDQRVAKLAEASGKCKVPGLTFGDGGAIVFENTTAGMLSTSQLMRLSSALSALYPKGLGLELLDRGESLGRSIFGLIDQAKRDERTILAAVVGDKPAQTPDDVGVWIVEKGAVKQ